MITAQENKRTARSPNDPFDQQQQDVSFLLGNSFKQQWDNSFNQQQEQDISSLLNPQINEINHGPLNTTTTERPIPVYPRRSYHGDTRVNDLLFVEDRSGGLIRLEPDAEFVDRDKFQNQE